MTENATIRLALLIIFSAFMPCAMYFRIRSKTSERLDRRQEGMFILVGLRASALPLLAGVVAWMVDASWMNWSSIVLPVAIRWSGVGLVAGWGFLLVWTFYHLGRNLTDTVVTRREHSLVMSGPYRYVRHPFYLSFATAVVGLSLAMGNWFILLAGILPLAFLFARTRIEEEKLLERFGAEYGDYMRRVGRFVPRW